MVLTFMNVPRLLVTMTGPVPTKLTDTYVNVSHGSLGLTVRRTSMNVCLDLAYTMDSVW